MARKKTKEGTAPPSPAVQDASADEAVANGRLSFPIVGLGASAGGLEACTQMLRALPADTGMGFVLVQHLAPSHASMLAEILARATSMPVTEVHDEPSVQPNHVYVIPPNRNMVIEGSALKLLSREAGVPPRSIDVFLRSLAQHQRHQAIGVILSGTASDGTLGLQAIKAEGGITFAQDQSAQYEGMPRSAVAAGCVDFVLPPEEIARELARIAHHPYVAPAPPDARVEPVAEPNLARIVQLVRQATGVDFTNYKATTLFRRITRRMVLNKLEGLQDYAAFLQNNPAEVEALYQDILINVTSFFRNPEAFEVLKSKVFPQLVKDRSRHEALRIWTLGCSTGEEAYSLAMSYAEFAEAAGVQVPAVVFATDLNGEGIDKGRAGIYSRHITQDVSPERVRRFFVEVDGSYRISKLIRDVCVFARHNCLNDPPFSHIDLISCRNLLIYLEPVLQQKLVPLLHYALKPEGFLWLGTSETIGSYRDLFEVEDSRYRIYRKKAGPLAAAVGLTVSEQSPGHGGFGTKLSRLRELVAPTGAEVQKEADRIVLAKYAPAGVVVNADLEILQFRGDTGHYLAPAPGKASLNLLKMAREGLLVGLRAALHRAHKEETTVREEGLRVKSNGGYREVSVEVVPIRTNGAREGCFLVLFEEPATRLAAPALEAPTKLPVASHHTEAADRQITRLTQELAATREYLQSVIEQQEAANEELQSANEEVQSSNEELQSINEELETSKEEIQSSNEELATVNDELQNRNRELSQSHDDFTNLLNSVQLVMVMLGRDLRIRRFTPAAQKMMNLIPTDVGRPIGDIKLNLSVADLGPIVMEVIDTAGVRELEVQDKHGRWYSLRIRPYKTLENKVDGAVIVLVDVDRLKRAHEYAESIVDTVAEPLLVLDADLSVQRASRWYYQVFQTTPADTERRPFFELDNGQWHDPELRHELNETRLHDRSMDDFEISRDFARLGRRTMLLSAHLLEQSSTKGKQLLLTIKDISQRKQLEEDLRQRVEELARSDRSKNEFLAMLSHELRTPLAPMRHAVHVLKSPGLDSAMAAQMRDLMDRQVYNMARMIDDLLDVSRITRGKIQLRKEACDLRTILAGAAEAARAEVEARGETLSVTLASEPIYVEADPTRLEQVFGNLLNNSAKFTASGGHVQVTLASEARPPAQGDGDEAAGFWAVVCVRDDGAGIPAEVLPRVFDLFTQAEQTLERSRGGLGIGLTLVQRLVEMHGGTVEAASDGADLGSTFTVRLPIMKEKPAAAVRPQRQTPATAPLVGPRRVLVVDDNADGADSLALLLRLGGHQVETAYTGQGALDAAIASRPEIVLLDIGLPGMDGYEVARRLRQRSELRQTMLVALTGYGQEEDRRRARDAGFDHHLTKPVEPSAFEELFARYAASHE